MSNLPIKKEQEVKDNEIDVAPVLSYLKTEQGHELASRVVQIIEGIQKTTLETNSKHVVFELWFKVITVVLVVIVASLLTWADKFNPTMGILFGTLVGYVFGKKS